MRPFAPALALAIALLLPLGASGLMIDDFSGATQSVTDSVWDGTPVVSEEAHSVLGGSRFVGVNQVGAGGSVSLSAGGGTASGSHTGAGHGPISFAYDGAVDGSVAGTDGSLNIDLTQGGALDRFRVEVLSVSGFVQIRTTASDGDSGTSSVVTVSTPGTYDFLFSSFAGVDFTDIRSVYLASWSNTFDGEDTIVFGSFSAVPEPSAGLLVASGLVGLAMRRRRLH